MGYYGVDLKVYVEYFDVTLFPEAGMTLFGNFNRPGDWAPQSYV